MGASLTLTAYEVANSVNVANNTSQVYIQLDITTYDGTWSHDNTTSGSITLDGAQIANLNSAWVDMNTTTNLYKGTHTITHNSDGTKTVAISASFDMNTATRWIYASKNVELTTIARKSTLSVGNGTLDSPLTFTITELAAAHTHKIKYFCGSAEGYVLGSASTTSTALSTSWTPPTSLAAQNTTGKSLSVTYTVYTFNANGALIGENSYSRTLAIPSSVKPSCSVSVSDANGYATKYGGYVQGLSRLSVSVTGAPIYGSPIASYNVSANGKTYQYASFTTDVLSSATSPQTITATVTDKRGWPSNPASASITVLPYTLPSASLSAVRVDSNGNLDEQGERIKATFSASVASLNGKNTKSVTLKYKKSTASSYTIVSNATSPYTFAADADSSYDVLVEVTDDFNTTPRNATVSTAFALMNFKADGTGMGIGKVSEVSNALDMGVPIVMNGNKVKNVANPTEAGDAIPSNGATMGATVRVCGDPQGVGWYRVGILRVPKTGVDSNTLAAQIVFGNRWNSGRPSTAVVWALAEYQHAALVNMAYLSQNTEPVISQMRLVELAVNAYALDIYYTVSASANVFVDVQMLQGAFEPDTLSSVGSATASALLTFFGESAGGHLHPYHSSIGNARTNGEKLEIYSTPEDAAAGSGCIGFIGGNGSTFDVLSYSRGMDIYTGGNMRFYAASAMKIALLTDRLRPNGNDVLYLGDSSNRWKAVYAVNGSIQTSDRNQKKNIAEIDQRYIELFDKLQPVTFEFNDKESDRVHIGYISQDVKAAMDEVGLSDMEFAGYCRDIKIETDEETDTDKQVFDEDGNPVYLYSLRYSEFIALNSRMIQLNRETIRAQQAEIEALRGEVDELKKAVAAVLAKYGVGEGVQSNGK